MHKQAEDAKSALAEAISARAAAQNELADLTKQISEARLAVSGAQEEANAKTRDLQSVDAKAKTAADQLADPIATVGRPEPARRGDGRSRKILGAVADANAQLTDLRQQRPVRHGVPRYSSDAAAKGLAGLQQQSDAAAKNLADLRQQTDAAARELDNTRQQSDAAAKSLADLQPQRADAEKTLSDLQARIQAAQQNRWRPPSHNEMRSNSHRLGPRQTGGLRAFAGAHRDQGAVIAGAIRVGVGGWTFEPWRGVFYPEGLAHKRELEFASRALTSIEINGTYYSTFAPDRWRKWRDETPDGFVFSVKASRFCTNRKVLASAGEAIARFIAQGLTELGDKLGPINWQFMATKKFDPEDFAAFLALLPREKDGTRAAPRRRGPPSDLCDAGLLRPRPKTRRRDRLRQGRGIPRDRPADRRFHLRPTDGEPGEPPERGQRRRAVGFRRAGPRLAKRGDVFAYFISAPKCAIPRRRRR